MCPTDVSQRMPSRPDDDDDDDDVPDEEDQDFEEEPKVDTSFKQTIIVDGLPKVPKEKHEKLINVLRKFFSQVGTIVEDGLEMPYSENGESMGCARPQLDPRRICLVLVPSSLLSQPSVRCFCAAQLGCCTAGLSMAARAACASTRLRRSVKCNSAHLVAPRVPAASPSLSLRRRPRRRQPS